MGEVMGARSIADCGLTKTHRKKISNAANEIIRAAKTGTVETFVPNSFCVFLFRNSVIANNKMNTTNIQMLTCLLRKPLPKI